MIIVVDAFDGSIKAKNLTESEASYFIMQHPRALISFDTDIYDVKYLSDIKVDLKNTTKKQININ